jgi:hypothetical protein
MGAGPFAQRLEEVAHQAALERASGRPAPADVQVGAALPLASRVPYEGASRVLRWATNLVLSAGYDQKHPMSNKVVLTVRLRDLAREVGLSREGTAWIAAVCGPRCGERGKLHLAAVLTRRLRAGTRPAPTRCAW